MCDYKVYLDGVEVRVGDNMYDMFYGDVTVTKIITDRAYPIRLTNSTGAYLSFSVEGKINESYGRTLYWSKPEIPIPKRKVKRWIAGYEKENNLVIFSTIFYKTKEEARNSHGNMVFVAEIEIEERFVK